MTNVILAMGGSRIGLLRADCRETEGCGHAPEAGIQIELACEFADCPPCRFGELRTVLYISGEQPTIYEIY